MNVSDFGILLLNGGHFFYNQDVLGHIKKQVVKVIHEDSGFFERFSKQAEKTYKNGIEFAKKISPVEEITSQVFMEFLSHGYNMTLYWCFAAVHLAQIAEKEFQHKASEHSIPPEIIPQLIPAINTPLLEQQKELLTLKKEIGARTKDQLLNDKSLWKKLEAHTQKYAWIEITNWVGQELTVERLLEQIGRAEEKKEDKNFDTANMPRQILNYGKYLSHIAFAKQAGSEYVAMYAQLTREFLTKTAKRIGVTYQEMMFLSHREILTALDDKKYPGKLKEIIPQRQDWRWLAAAENHHVTLFADNPSDIAYLEQLMIPRADQNSPELKGATGNPGKAEGIARIIMNVSDFHKMQIGDVLVTTMTTPDFVILMQKACAIVTDIGGMLCHAAIISREMGKPCVIGTRFATQIIKDGDLVEVDADKATVKILQK